METKGIQDAHVNQSILNHQKSRSKEIPYLVSPGTGIELNPDYKIWMKNNFRLIEAFTLYELVRFLEKNNPGVSNLSLKVFRPGLRNLHTATQIWRDFIRNNGSALDVFEQKPLKRIESLSMDHFLPWSFLTHDLIWNLHPIEKRINSAKSNCLPSRHYLDDFIHLQYNFLKFLIHINHNKLLEEYYIFTKISAADLKKLEHSKFRNKFRDFYLPQFEIALNMGFEGDWVNYPE